MARAAILSYIKRNSLVHELTGHDEADFLPCMECGIHDYLRYESTVGDAFDQYCGF